MKKQNWVQVVTAALLSAVLLVNCILCTSAETAATACSDPEGNILSEDVSRRSAYEKHFARSDGSFVAAVYTEPVHYQNAAGEWVEIDNRLRASRESGAPV